MIVAVRPPGFNSATSSTSSSPVKRSAARFVGLLRPRFLQELIVVPMKDALVIDGTAQLQVIQGKATGRLVPELIALMDGSRTIPELEAALPSVPAEYVNGAISLLVDCGLVESGISNPAFTPIPNPEAVAFFRRFVATTHASANGRDAYEKLQASEVVILDTRVGLPQSEILKSLLQKSGVGSVIFLEPEPLKSLRPQTGIYSPERLVIAVSLVGEEPALYTKLDDWCCEHQLPWLRAVVDRNGDYADIGPLFNHAHTPCYGCFRAVHDQSPDSADSTNWKLSPAAAHFWLSLITTEVIYLINRAGPLITGQDFQRYNLNGWDSQSLRWSRVPGCSRCLPMKRALSAEKESSANRPDVKSSIEPALLFIETALLFEEYVGLQSRDFSVPMRAKSVRLAMALSRQMKRLPNSQSYALDGQIPRLERGALDLLQAEAVNPNERLTLGQLASLLMMTAGVRRAASNGNTVKRWAATAGNLGSVELFVAARDVEGLPPGFYFYQAGDHSLASLQRHREALLIEEFMRRVALVEPDHLPRAMILFTGAYQRVARKYGPFAYRLINLDGGAALSQLHFVAQAMNVRSYTMPCWASDLIEEELNLEPFEEQPTAVVAISGARSGHSGSSGPTSKLSANITNTPKAVCEFNGLSMEKVVEMLNRESRISEKELHLSPFIDPAPILNRSEERRLVAALPRPACGGRLAGELLSSRVSVRQFTPDRVALDQLSSMLFYAHQRDTKDWPQETQDNLPLSFLAIAWRVEGIEPAVYLYDPQKHGLSFSSAAPSPPEAVELFVQDEFASVPLVIWIAGDLAGACARYGAFGHRQLLLRAGAAGHRLWMAALAMGLSGSLVSGLIPGAARRQLGLDGYNRASLFAFVTGHGIASFGEPGARRLKVAMK